MQAQLHSPRRSRRGTVCAPRTMPRTPPATMPRLVAGPTLPRQPLLGPMPPRHGPSPRARTPWPGPQWQQVAQRQRRWRQPERADRRRSQTLRRSRRSYPQIQQRPQRRLQRWMAEAHASGRKNTSTRRQITSCKDSTSDNTTHAVMYSSMHTVRKVVFA